MNTRSYKITYANGNTEVVTTDAVDTADQINRTFGLTVEEAASFGCAAELIEDAPVEVLNKELAHQELVHIQRGVSEASVASDSTIVDAPPATEASRS